MAKEQNMATSKELNDIELELVSYLIDSDELIFKTLGENSRFTKPLHMGEPKDINLVQSINSPMEFSQSVIQDFDTVWWLI